MSRQSWAAVAATAVALVTGTSAVALAAPTNQGPVPGVTVSRFVVHDASGHVVAHGATATLPGHRAITAPTTEASGIRVATARRGHAVVVRVLDGTAGRPQVATR